MAMENHLYNSICEVKIQKKNCFQKVLKKNTKTEAKTEEEEEEEEESTKPNLVFSQENGFWVLELILFSCCCSSRWF